MISGYRWRHAASAACALCAIAATTTPAWAQANAGVSEERVTLPQAPGSLSGVGENAAAGGNQGALTYSVDIEVPPGFPGVTPSLALAYSSTAGSGIAGMGWSMPTFSIERMTAKGLQAYDKDDRFAADGSEELVRVSESGGNAVYRARFEGGFVRYTWMGRGGGEAGWWKAEWPDGRIGYFGADASGTAVSRAQVVVPETSRVFRWHLVSVVDPWGHAMSFNYTKDETGHPLLERIDYLYEGAMPRHSVRFTYERRPDILSDARPGFDLRLGQRLKEVRIFSGTTSAEQIRRYAVSYESDAVSPGTSRVASIARFGRGEIAHPVKYSFGYSQTLGGACDAQCDKPFVREMGTVGGVDFSTGRATLIDINGDALPDVLYSDAQGRHQFFYASFDGEGKTSFSGTPVESAKTKGSSSFVLGDPRVQVLDVNGDGFVDITQAKVPDLLCNKGLGDWVDADHCSGASAPGLPSGFTPEDEDGDALQQAPRFVRFFDYDNDKRIDWLRTAEGGNSTVVLANRPEGFQEVPVENIGAVFDESPLQLADMNGDGLQDPVQILSGSSAAMQVQYRLNLGFGRWGEWRMLTLTGLDASQASAAEIEDINGDGLADIVAVTGNEVRLALNRNGEAFGPVMLIDSASLGSGAIPARAASTVVSYADMNGNGSADIVFIQPTGAISYLELFPVRPNLITRIENGLGAVQLIQYGTSIAEQGRDIAERAPWAHRVPHAMTVVTRVDSFVALTGNDSGGLRETVLYRYHSGFYDGVEKQFRGYEVVEQEHPADASRDAQEPGLFKQEYDVGESNPALAGLLTKRSSFAGAMGSLAPLHEDAMLHELCPVAEIGIADVRFVCERATTSVLIERNPSAAVTTRVEREYDGYGNVVLERNLGVVSLGTPSAPTACAPCTSSGTFGAPCGSECSGDEHFVEEDFVAPGADTGGAWILHKPKRQASGAVATSLPVETLYYYDGPDFEGLALGKLTRGKVSRVTRRTGPGAADIIAVDRFKRDAHGNVVEGIEPNGSVSNVASGRRTYTYDASGLNATSVEVKLTDAVGGVNSIRREMTFEPAFELMSQSSSWFPMSNGAAAAPRQMTSYRYDEHGRLSQELEPGDTDASASKEYRYQLGDPASRVMLLRRTSATSGQDLQTASCFDGKGRLFQTRTLVSEGKWQVSGFTEYDARGAAARVYQPYLAASGECEKAPPAGVKFVANRYDPLGRLKQTTEPDGAMTRTEYGPLEQRKFDEDNNDPASAAANAPIVEAFDGLNRLVSITRTGSGALASATTRVEYDETGKLSVARDPAGNFHAQTYDSAGRLLKVTDPNSGLTTFEYDEAGNLLKKTDARGKVVRAQYDGANRVLARWDEADEANTKVTFKYDKVDGCAECTNGGGQLVEVRWPQGSTPGVDRFGFDPRGLPVYTERTVDGHTFVTRRKFDQAGRQTRLIQPGDLSFPTAFDGESRVVSVNGYVDQIQYDARGDVSEMTYSNGAKTSYSYDDKRQLASHKAMARDGSAFIDESFTRSRRGNVLTQIDAADRAENPHRSAKYTYDAWHRVIEAELPRAGAESEILSFSFDALDNILSQTSSLGAQSPAHVGAYQYEASRPNAVTSAGTTAYAYDAAGSAVSRGDVAYERDHEGRLVAALRGGSEVGRFIYGAGVNRVVKKEGDSTTYYLPGGAALKDGIVNAWVRLGRQRVARVQSDTLAAVVLSDLAPAAASGTQLTAMGDRSITVADAWVAQAASAGAAQLSGGPAPSPVKALLASSARRLLMNDVTWLHGDSLQSVVASTDGEGRVVAQQSFYPTGSVRDSSGYVDQYWFSGQESDDSTGLVHYTYRDLDAQAGRWTSVDPVFTELSDSSVRRVGEAAAGYAYVQNDFANSIDPLGLASNLSAFRPGPGVKQQLTPMNRQTAIHAAALFGAGRTTWAQRRREPERDPHDVKREAKEKRLDKGRELDREEEEYTGKAADHGPASGQIKKNTENGRIHPQRTTWEQPRHEWKPDRKEAKREAKEKRRDVDREEEEYTGKPPTMGPRQTG